MNAAGFTPQGGKAGEGGNPAAQPPFAASTPTNTEFLATIFSDLPDGACAVVTAMTGDPKVGGNWRPSDAARVADVCPVTSNTYFNCASLFSRDGEGRHKPLIRHVPGEMNAMLAGMEEVLASRGDLFQSGDVIVSVAHDPVTGDATINPVGESALTLALSAASDWEKFDGRKNEWVRSDPPLRHVGMLYKAQAYTRLPVLRGLARQPYYDDQGELHTAAGYDPSSQRIGVFDASKFTRPDTSVSEDLRGSDQSDAVATARGPCRHRVRRYGRGLDTVWCDQSHAHLAIHHRSNSGCEQDRYRQHLGPCSWFRQQRRTPSRSCPARGHDQPERAFGSTRYFDVSRQSDRSPEGRARTLRDGRVDHH